MQGPARKLNYPATWIGVGLLLLIAGYIYYSYFIISNTDIPIFKVLKEQEYTPNEGFSGAFNPGTLIQIKETGPEGEDRTLKTPFVFLWRSDCFPGLKPRVNTFVLPQSHGKSKTSLSLGAEALTRFVSTMQLDNNAIVDYKLEIKNLRVHTFAKGELSGKFSEKCVQAYDLQIAAGDKSDWYAVILDSLVAEKLIFEVDWKANTSAEARAEVTKQTIGALHQMLENVGPQNQASSASVQLKNEDSKHTIFSADGPVIIGYRAKPFLRKFLIPDVSITSENRKKSLRDEYYRNESDSASFSMIGSVSIMLIEAAGSREVRYDHPFNSGDKFRLSINSNQPGWLYIFHRSPGENYQQLWPQKDLNQNALTHQGLKVGESYLIPPSPASFRFDEQIGQEEFIIAITSEKKSPDLTHERTSPDITDEKHEESVGTPGNRDTETPPRYETTGNIIIRNAPFGGDVSRGVYFDPGTEDPDPRLYFTAVPGDNSTHAILNFKLRHAK